MKKSLLIIFFFYLFACCGWAKKVASFPGLFRVDHFNIDDHQLYITQGFNIYIYSRKDYKLLKKFGKRGDGPREFNGFVHVAPYKDYLVITSSGKISFFNKQGEFQREIKSVSSKNGIFLPLGEGFVGRGYDLAKKNLLYRTINLYDGRFKKGSEIFRYTDQFRKKAGKRKYNLMEDRNRRFRVINNKILVGHPNGSITVFDKKGSRMTTIKRTYEKIPFKEIHKKELIDTFLLTNPGKKGTYKQWKNMLEFPTHFPPIQLFQTSDEKVFVLTHKRVSQKAECFVYDLEGKLLKQTMASIIDLSPKEPYPLAFFKGKIYQVYEKEDTETWQLQVIKIL